ncbi:MAG: GNAT family N-acetyltransferase [Chloroflexi bacterium]|nr:GNAT family N-acetyltransferase [Chloroflexota bacterium]
MKLGFFDDARTGEALQTLLANPYDNAPLIADLTEFKVDCLFVSADDETGLRGLLSVYSGFTSPVIAAWCDDATLLRRMLRKAASRCARVRDGFVWCLGGESTLGLLERTVRVDRAREEVQMKLDLQKFHCTAADDCSRAIPLSVENLADLNTLYDLVPPEAWRSEDLLRGPYRGIYEGGKLVAAAGVHWATPWIAEIGNVAVHPDSRRRGLAEACVAAVVGDLKGLTERAYLMVFAENEAAINLYLKMGFEEVQRMRLVGFLLSKCLKALTNVAPSAALRCVGRSASIEKEGRNGRERA